LLSNARRGCGGKSRKKNSYHPLEWFASFQQQSSNFDSQDTKVLLCYAEFAFALSLTHLMYTNDFSSVHHHPPKQPPTQKFTLTTPLSLCGWCFYSFFVMSDSTHRVERKFCKRFPFSSSTASPNYIYRKTHYASIYLYYFPLIFPVFI
jgi:hypothetical protein